MKKPNGSSSQPVCRLTHDLMNQLTVIAIYCDLLNEESSVDAETHRRLHLIRAAARSIVEELSSHRCERDEAVATELPVPQLPS
jgi:hypothetical protein